MSLLLLAVAVVLVVGLRGRLSRAEQEIARLRAEVRRVDAAIAALTGRSTPEPPTEEVQADDAIATSVPPPIAPAPIPAPPASSAPVAAGAARVPSGSYSNPNSYPNPDTVERAIGERWLLYAGILVLLLGVAFFLRYAFDRNWLSPAVRVALGLAAGASLLAGGFRFATAGYQRYGLIVSGAGIAALFLSIYAALNFYHLIPIGLAFVALVIVSGATAWLADRVGAAPLAVVAVVGGFGTPFLVGVGEDAQLTLFTYDALLIAAVMILAFRRDWWFLNVVSAAMTIASVSVWAVSFYTDARAIRTELFLSLYCAMFLVIARAGFASSVARVHDASRALLALPVFYYMVSIGILFTHREAFSIFLIAVTLVTCIVADRLDRPLLRAVVFLAVAPPFALWLDRNQLFALAPPLVTLIAIYVMHLAAQLQAARADRALGPYDVALVHANGLGVYAALSILLARRMPQHLWTIAAALALWNVALAFVMRRRVGLVALHWGAVAATLAAVAVAIRLDGPWVVVMWAVEGAAVMTIALRLGQGWFRLAGWVLIAIAIVRWIAPDVQETVVSFVPILNPRALSGALIVALLYVLAVRLRREIDVTGRRRAVEQAILLLVASAMTVAVLTVEIHGYWTLHDEGDGVDIIREAMVSTMWAVYAAGAIAAGIRRGYPPIRYFAIALFGVTLAKVFAVDLDTLAGIYRILAFLVVGLVLLFASFLYQRRRSA